MKTNAMRQLDQAKIAYETLEYDLDKDLFSGERVSDLLGLEYGQCYKTLALKHDHDVFICVISVKDELDLKKCAKACGVKNVEMVHVKDLLKLVGYERGSVTPVGVKKNRGIIFDDETDGIDSIGQGMEDTNADWFTLDGCKLNGKPTAKGVYVVKGRKVVVR